VRAGRRVVVVPPGEAPDGAGDELDVVVTVDPGAAFGSGSHATTRMAVAALEQEVGEGSRVLDVGSGTGVLSIVAARLGAASVVAVDVDDEAVRVTTANVARNEVAERVVVVEAVDRVDRTAPFDVVVANVSAGVLVELAPAILAVLADDGVALLTGILDERAAEVEAAWTDAAGGRVVTRRASEDGWTLLEVHLPVGQ
jgi:ribosomal protein L11 methyltransferase